jgi:hypothetical protein
MDEQEVLEDFTISINIQDIYANARLTTNEEAFTETLMNLYDYGLVFNEITFAQLNADIDYINENFMLIMAENGLSLNMTDNYDNLLVMFPFLADETIIQEILTRE